MCTAEPESMLNINLSGLSVVGSIEMTYQVIESSRWEIGKSYLFFLSSHSKKPILVFFLLGGFPFLTNVVYSFNIYLALEGAKILDGLIKAKSSGFGNTGGISGRLGGGF